MRPVAQLQRLNEVFITTVHHSEDQLPTDIDTPSLFDMNWLLNKAIH